MSTDRADRLAEATTLLTTVLALLDALGEDDAALKVQHALDVVGQPERRGTARDVAIVLPELIDAAMIDPIRRLDASLGSEQTG
jgi:hypothetical protein